ncbi:hypothetical protein [Variovorax paradoxus]|uniref:Uncharacterized protein n=1 Tax=Variovorax paradoxus (strain EPS) TaxID=595537 RepID=E6V215_VARPE|nr:hypothetical protein [Variovorax paradoxus]ADU39094.1 hypothetical protein Varpa_4934 [Variovorax paradoxus EPS]
MKRQATLLRWVLCLAWLCMGGLAFAAPPQRDWPAIPSPSGAKNYWVAQYMEHNTIPMQIRGFESAESMQEISRYYEKWFADKTGYGVSSVGESRVLGARLGVYQVTVQLRAVPSGTVGRLVAAVIYEEGGGSAEERAERVGKGFPRPPGSLVISDTLSYDEGQRNRTIMVTNGVSVETNALYLREQMIRLGWTLLQDRTVEGGERSALVFRRGAEEMVVTIARRDDAYIVVASQTTPD